MKPSTRALIARFATVHDQHIRRNTPDWRNALARCFREYRAELGGCPYRRAA